MQLLLAHGADFRAIDQYGHDALFYASAGPSGCDVETVKVLLAAGATGRCN